MIQFQAVEATNFNSFEKVYLSYQCSGLHLIQGENLDSPVADSNESGKTNLFEALLWGLFGQATREKNVDGAKFPNVNVNDVIHTGKSDCRVKVWFDCDGSDYVIGRSRSKNGMSSLVIEELHPKGLVSTIEGASKAETQKLIEQLIGFNYETFIQTIVFGQSTRRFSQARDSERKKTLEDLLELGVFSEALEKVRAAKKPLAKELDKLSQEASRTTVRIEESEKSLAFAQLNYEEQQEAYKNWQENIEGQKKQLKQSKKRVTEMLEALKVSLFAANQTLKRHEDGVKESIGSEAVLKGKVEALSELGFKLTQLGHRRRTMKGVDKLCPTCEQGVSAKYAAGVDKKINEDIREHKKLEQKMILECDKADEEFKILKHNRECVTDVLKEIADLKHKQVNHKEWLEFYISDLKMLEEETPERDKPDRTQVKEIEDKIEALIIRFGELEASMEDVADELLDLEFWEKGFGNQGIKSLMMDGILPALNSSASRYISLLSGGSVDVEFDTESFSASGKARDKFDVRITTRSGEGYHFASGGGRRRVDFAIALALQGLQAARGGKCNLFILDEPFESVDEAGQEEVVNLLREYSRQHSVAVYCITHLTTLKPLFDNVITVQKKDGVSRIV